VKTEVVQATHPHVITMRLGFSSEMSISENRVLRRIFGPKRDEVTGEWRKLHNEERRDLYSSPCIIRIMKSVEEDEMGWSCSTNGGEEECV
jgi:hypothetical protein